jgi:hypothetical protein
MKQVIGKRKKMLIDMIPGLETELQQSLVNESVATREGREKVVAWFQLAVECEWLSREAEWYNHDE